MTCKIFNGFRFEKILFNPFCVCLFVKLKIKNKKPPDTKSFFVISYNNPKIGHYSIQCS